MQSITVILHFNVHSTSANTMRILHLTDAILFSTKLTSPINVKKTNAASRVRFINYQQNTVTIFINTVTDITSWQTNEKPRS